MNKERRQRLSEAADSIQEIISDIEAVRDEETDAFENMPEGLQYARQDQYDEAIDAMDEFVEGLQGVADDIESFVNS